MDDKGYTMICPRCGAEMNSNSRYCLKCGNLNYEHEANKNMRPFIENNKETYQVGSGNFIVESNNKDVNDNISLANNTGSEFLCFIVTYLIYILLFGGIGLLFFKEMGYDINAFLASSFPLISIGLTITFIYIYSFELIYIKCNKRWWSGLIPIYNNMVLADITFQKQWIGLLVLIPVVGEIVLLVMLYKLGKDFKYNGILVAILSFIFIPLIGLGDHSYRGYTFIGEEGKISLEKRYSYKKTFLMTSLLIFVLSLGSYIYSNISVIKEYKAGNYYYVLASSKMLDNTKKIIQEGASNCESTYSNIAGVYYFTYPDVGDVVHLPFYYLREPISGYVKVDNTMGEAKYYVTLSDGELGFYEIDSNSITKDVVTNYNNNSFSGLSVKCPVKK